MESICEGIPMICQPYFADQMVNSRYSWVALRGETGGEEGIERAIRRVMVEADGQGMEKRAMYLKEKSGYLSTARGSSYQSLGRLTDHILSL
ncbi:hypothetical protein CUMW_276550 [Citrus unshiu]|uniref:Uncharacterized protein n=1 Tax=Citrus unshiu TaxID=55188 RepID=A0A2H5N1S0_CITUN|nr:hypothetical protein CUMW_276550 [Citrus unshiu]